MTRDRGADEPVVEGKPAIDHDRARELDAAIRYALGTGDATEAPSDPGAQLVAAWTAARAGRSDLPVGDPAIIDAMRAWLKQHGGGS